MVVIPVLPRATNRMIVSMIAHIVIVVNHSHTAVIMGLHVVPTTNRRVIGRPSNVPTNNVKWMNVVIQILVQICLVVAVALQSILTRI